jgi:predicted transcriptional regulator
MIAGLTLLDSDLVILGVFAFLGGLAGMVFYTRFKTVFEERRYKTNEAVVDAIVLDYTRKLREYDKVISELRTKIDILEDKNQLQRVISQHPSQIQPHVAPVSESVTITQHPKMENEVNSTTDYILKLLAERPRSSREVQFAIGRTREHTARLMKKLHDLGLVSRDINSKPFQYNLTDVGREMLKKKEKEKSVGAASVAV